LNTFFQPRDPEQPENNLELVPQRPGKRGIAKRIAVWLGACLAVLLVVVFICIVSLSHVRSFRQYALRIAENRLSSSLGTEVRVRDFTFSPWHLTLDLYGIAVAGANPYPDPPLLTVDHVGVGVGISSLLHREWYLRELTVNHPVAHLFTDVHGKSNLPVRKGNGPGHTDIFRLGARHVLLDRGDIFYNNREKTLDADLHDMEFHSEFAPSQQRYSGGIQYHDGHLRMQGSGSIPHDLSAEFDATPDQFTLRRAVLSSGSSKLELTATVSDYSNPQINGNYTALLDCGEFRRILNNPSMPVGIVNASGTLGYRSQNDVPMMASVQLSSDLTSRSLIVRRPDFHGEIADIEAHVTLANGNASVTGAHANFMGGTVAATASVRDIPGTASSRLHATVRGVSLQNLQHMANTSSMEPITLSGALNADADAYWQKKLDHLTAKIDAAVIADARSKSGEGGHAIPVNGEIHGNYVATKKELSLRQSGIRLPQTSLKVNGTISKRSSLQINFQSNDLHELQEIAEMVRPGLRDQLGAPGIYGTAAFRGSLQGSTNAPQLTGQLRAANLKFKESAWPVIQTNVDLSPSHARLLNGEIQPASGGRIAFHMNAQLRHWSFEQTSPVEMSLRASQVNVADFTALVHPQTPIRGMIAANLSVTGTASNPTGSGTITLSKASLWNEPVQLATVNFRAVQDQLEAKLDVKVPAGAAKATLTYAPKTQQYQAQVQAIGVRLEQLRALKSRNLPVTGILNITASGQGSVKNPQFTANIESPQLQVHAQRLGDLKLQASMADHMAKLAMNAHAIDTLINANATVNMTGNYQTDATIDTEKIPLQPLVAVYAPSQGDNVTGQAEFHLRLHGPLKDNSALEAHFTVPVFAVSYMNKFQLAAANPIQADLTHGVLTLQKAAIRGTGTDVQVQASIPVSNSAPASILAKGTVDLQVAQLFNPDITSSGQLQFDINSYGARSDPNVEGQIHVVNANLTSNSAPVGLQNGNGVLTLTKDRLNINDFSGTVGGGKVQASGGILYRPSVRFDLALSGKGVRMLYPEGMRQMLSADLTLTGNFNTASLGGQVRINQLGFTPDFDLNGFMGQFAGQVEPPPTQSFADNLQLNLTVQSPNGVNLVSRELSLDGNADLNIRGTAAEPVILGRVNLNSGDLIFMGNRYLLQGGTIDFANASETLPVLNVTANTTIQQYDIQLQFTGPADHLRTNYTSVPSLPPSDIINLLVFGKTSEASATNPMPGNLGAESLIASQISSQVTNRVEKIAGISRLSIDPVLAGSGSQQNPGARITIQQRVTGNIFVTFSTDVTQTENQVIELQYNVTPKVTVSGTRDQNGGFGFDTRIKKTW
jgi:translocation and assembly module TamB